MNNQTKEPTQTNEKSRFTKGVLVGGLVGAATALLLTPKSGKELRKDLANQTTNLKEKSIQMKDEAKLQTNLGTMAGKEKASNMVGTVKDKAIQMKATAKDKMNAMKSKNEEPTPTPTIQRDPGLPPSPDAASRTLGE